MPFWLCCSVPVVPRRGSTTRGPAPFLGRHWEKREPFIAAALIVIERFYRDIGMPVKERRTSRRGARWVPRPSPTSRRGPGGGRVEAGLRRRSRRRRSWLALSRLRRQTSASLAAALEWPAYARITHGRFVLGPGRLAALGHGWNVNRPARGAASGPHVEKCPHGDGPTGARSGPGAASSVAPTGAGRTPCRAATRGGLGAEATGAVVGRDDHHRATGATARRCTRRWSPKPVVWPTWASPRSTSSGVVPSRMTRAATAAGSAAVADVEASAQCAVAPVLVVVLCDGHDGIP